MDDLIQRLGQFLDQDALVTDQMEREYYSMDAFSSGETCCLVLKPKTKQQVEQAVKIISSLGYQIIPRGGGMSYTGGYTPSSEETIIIDVQGLNKIVEINKEDMFITVEAGCTWKDIYESLQPLGLRLPFFGTNSGAKATVGGGLSNGALFFGTGAYGTAADNVMSMEVILADGTVIKTGQAAFADAKPHHRTYGPDLTGLFCHDAGAFGIKIQATFRLIYTPAWTDYLSFSFKGILEGTEALSAIARSRLTEECYLLDPSSADNLTDISAVRGLKSIFKVMLKQNNFATKLFDAAKMALSGRQFIPKDHYSLHCVIGGNSRSSVKENKLEVRKLMKSFDAQEVANTIPKAARADPFPPLNGIIGSKGERWAALNAKVPHSKAKEVNQKIYQIMESYQDQMDSAGVWFTLLNLGIEQHSYSIEPVLRWKDEWSALHKKTASKEFLNELTESKSNPAARQLVDEIRNEIVAYFASIGAASNQIGRTYDFLGYLHEPTKSLIHKIKSAVDPMCIMNKGALGLEKGHGAAEPSMQNIK